MNTVNNSDDLIFSLEASSTRFMFYKELNDINIFVEDAEKEYEYETIFKRLLGSEYTIKSIFSAGGKQGVIDKYNEFGVTNKDNPKIHNFYLVDGDFDRYICPEDMINDAHFMYLETYNIENYLIDEDACVMFTKGRMKCFDDEAKCKLKFDYWRNKVVSESEKLFFIYCFVKNNYPKHATLSRGTGEFIDAKTGFEREDGAFEKYKKSIALLDASMDSKIVSIKEKYIETNGNDFFNLICGKFLLDSLCWYVRSVIGSKFNHDDFKWHLINHFDISKLAYVKNAIAGIQTM